MRTKKCHPALGSPPMATYEPKIPIEISWPRPKEGKLILLISAPNGVNHSLSNHVRMARVEAPFS